MKSKGKSQDFLTTPPLQIEDALVSLPSQEHPKTYLMSHLLATGFRGTEYQLSVLLWRLIMLLLTHRDFEAVTEIEGYGNLDDIGLVIKDEEGQVVQVETYQVKYYNHPIIVQDFFESSEEQINANKETKNKKSKTEKMHIGKFFAGWLSWQANYPQLAKEKIQSIIFTNTTLSTQFLQCINNNRFAAQFISHENKIIVERKTTQVGKVCKKFLYIQGQISLDKSTKIWDFLHENDFIDDKGFFTEKYSPTAPNFSLGLSKTILKNKRSQLTEAYVIEQLAPMYEEYIANQIDLFTVLKREAWAYLTKKKLHKEICELPDLEKDKRFQEFLQSVRFQVNQHPIAQLETDIQEGLMQIQQKPTDQVYLCLYYAIRAWFRKEEPYSQRTILTAALTRELIQQAEIRSNELILLQGRSEEILSNISYFSLGQCIVPNASYQLERLLQQSGIILVSGNKGMGKSATVKFVLEQSFHPSQYLFFSAEKLLNEDALKERLSNVVKIVASIQIVVIDNAELFFSVDASVLQYYIDLVNHFSRTLVLNIAAELLNTQKRLFRHHAVNMEPLAVRDILHYFPQLAPYQTVHPLIELARRPFYLNTILQISTQIGAKELDEIKKLSDVALQAKLVKIALEGTDVTRIEERKSALQQLVYAIVSSETNLNRQATLPCTPKSFDSLQKDGFIICQNDQYSFSHDLFFEYALMFAWQLDWEHAQQKGNTAKFWEKFKKHMAFQDRVFIFEKWVALYSRQITTSLIEHWKLIESQGYHNHVIAMAFVTNNDVLFNYLLQQKIILVNELLYNIRGYNAATAALLAIWLDYPGGLKLLLNNGARPHHPQASYYQPRLEIEKDDCSDSEPATDSSSSDSDDNQTNDEYSSNHDYHQNEDSEPDELVELIQSFAQHTEKYCFARFNEEPDYWDDGDYISNEAYQQPADNHLLYLHQAASHNRVACLQILLEEYKANNQQWGNLTNRYNETALHLAALNGANEAIETLLDAGATINCVDSLGETLLHNAVYKSHITTARLLLENNIAVNACNDYGITALHIALVTLNLDMVKLLFSYGADISLHAFAEQVAAADLLEHVWDLPHKRDEVEEFVLRLVELLNYGYEADFDWGRKSANPDPKIRQAQLDEVEDLVTLVEHRAQISDWQAGFDYTDEEEELEYTLEHGDHEKLEELSDYILNDSDNIAVVLEADSFSFVKIEILTGWLESANEKQYQNLKTYFSKDCEDQELMTCFNEYNSHSLSENEEDLEEQIAETEESPALVSVSVVPPFAKCITQNVSTRTGFFSKQLRNKDIPLPGKQTFFDKRASFFSTINFSTQAKKDTHWYTTEEMNQLIQLVAEEHDDVDIITPLLGTTHRGINELNDTLREWQNERHVKLSAAPQASKILVPVNVNQNHWILLYFILPTDSAMPTDVYHFDPFGGKVLNGIALAVVTITTVAITNLQAPLQRDGHNCGPWVIAAAASLITTGMLPNTECDIEKARIEQQQALAAQRVFI